MQVSGMWGGWLGDPKGPANSQSIESQKTEYCPLKGAPGTMGPHPHTGQNAQAAQQMGWFPEPRAAEKQGARP